MGIFRSRAISERLATFVTRVVQDSESLAYRCQRLGNGNAAALWVMNASDSDKQVYAVLIPGIPVKILHLILADILHKYMNVIPTNMLHLYREYIHQFCDWRFRRNYLTNSLKSIYHTFHNFTNYNVVVEPLYDY